MRDKFAGFLAGFAIVGALIWVMGNIARYTDQWIDWWAVIDAIPLVVFGLVVGLILIGMLSKAEKKDGS